MSETNTSDYTIEMYLNTFKKILAVLSTSDNIAIGGYQALRLHGLKLNRAPSDLDIIIFQPTKAQLQVLDVLKVFDVIRNRPKDIQNIKVYKFKKHDIFMDVILSKEMMPSLLSFGSFKVNSIENIIRAKSSYKFRYNEDDGQYGSETNLYARAKDMLDFQELKNLNFNFDANR